MKSILAIALPTSQTAIAASPHPKRIAPHILKTAIALPYIPNSDRTPKPQQRSHSQTPKAIASPHQKAIALPHPKSDRTPNITKTAIPTERFAITLGYK